jgi:hypothetical protein
MWVEERQYFFVVMHLYWYLYIEQLNKVPYAGALQCSYVEHCPLSEVYLINIQNVLGVFSTHVLGTLFLAGSYIFSVYVSCLVRTKVRFNSEAASNLTEYICILIINQ